MLLNNFLKKSKINLHENQLATFTDHKATSVSDPTLDKSKMTKAVDFQTGKLRGSISKPEKLQYIISFEIATALSQYKKGFLDKWIKSVFGNWPPDNVKRVIASWAKELNAILTSVEIHDHKQAKVIPPIQSVPPKTKVV